MRKWCTTMDYSFDRTLADGYKSSSQIIRVLTESWVAKNIYCPHCGCSTIQRFPNNMAVADYFCPKCQNEYELKSKNGPLGKKVADGAYSTFIERITSNNNPDFFFLSYSAEELCVNDLWIVPKYFFVPEIVEKRKPLSENAKRAGWVGCNILFDQIPQQGQIEIIKNRTPVDKKSVLAKMQRASSLRMANLDARGWLMDILYCVNSIGTEKFQLDDIYRFEEYLASKHPNNHNIRPKIRQQLQVLRDKGFIVFLGKGCYIKASGL